MQIGKYNMPDDLYYHKGHCWAKIEGDMAKIGYNNFGERLAGPIKSIELLDEEDVVSQNEPFGTLSSGKWAGKLESPIAGEIVEINEDVVDNPSAINEDPYGSWLVKIKMEDPGQVNTLFKGGTDALQQWLNNEITQFESKAYQWE